MKPFLTWLLIFIISFHWIGGHLVFKIHYSTEVKSRMNEVEKTIAEAVKEETGLELHLNTIDKDQINVKGVGYSGYFIFSKEIEGETRYFKIDSDPVKIVHQEYVAYQHRDREDSSDEMLLFQRLFSKFTVQYFLPSIAGKIIERHERNFAYSGLSDLFHPLVPTPPPRSA